MGKGPAPGRCGAVRELLSSSRSHAALAGERGSKGWVVPAGMEHRAAVPAGAGLPPCRSPKPGTGRRVPGAGPVEPRWVQRGRSARRETAAVPSASRVLHADAELLCVVS